MRKRINKVVKVLAELYNVTYNIAQRFYLKANGVIEEAKMYLRLYNLKNA
jgi:hypothetical protein